MINNWSLGEKWWLVVGNICNWGLACGNAGKWPVGTLASGNWTVGTWTCLGFTHWCWVDRACSLNLYNQQLWFELDSYIKLNHQICHEAFKGVLNVSKSSDTFKLAALFLVFLKPTFTLCPFLYFIPLFICLYLFLYLVIMLSDVCAHSCMFCFVFLYFWKVSIKCRLIYLFVQGVMVLNWAWKGFW